MGADHHVMVGAEPLRLWRARKGWTQHAIAERAGVSRSTVTNVERGAYRETSLPAQLAIAAALGLSPEWITEFREEAR